LEVAGVVVVEEATDVSSEDGTTEVSSEDGTTDVSSEDGTTEVSSEDGTVDSTDGVVDSTDGVVDSTDGVVEDAGVEDSDVVQAANMVITMTNASKTTSAFFFMRIVLLSKSEAMRLLVTRF